MSTDLDLVDKIAMYVGGALMVIAIPVMGTLTTLAGSMNPLYGYETAEGSGTVLSPALAPEGAEIVSAPLFDPNLRAAMVLLAFVIWGACAVYKLFDGGEMATDSQSTVARTAD